MIDHEVMSYSEMRTVTSTIGNHNLPVPFSLVVVTADRKKKTGGEFVKLNYVVKSANIHRKKRAVPKKLDSGETNTVSSKKDPNHWQQQTTNLAILARDEVSQKLVDTGQRIKIHYRLILFCNGKRVE